MRDVSVILRSTDPLGRRSKSRSRARKAYRNRFDPERSAIPISAFEPPRCTNQISVDRLDVVSDEEMARIADDACLASGHGFYGWFVLSVRDVSLVSTERYGACSVKSSPCEGNDYHADIELPVPLDVDDRKDVVREYARDLAYRASFRAWGDWTQLIDAG